MRAQIGQACDPCRLRKVRCQPATEASNEGELADHVGGQTVDDGSTVVDAGDSRCRRCVRLQLQCTFALPVGRRGPKGPRKKRPDSISASAHTSADTPAADHGLDGYHGSSQSIYGATMNHAVTDTSPTLGGHNIFTSVPTPVDTASPAWAITGAPCSTDQLCGRDTLRQILDDYILYLFPAIPVFHLPTFRASFDHERDRHDDAFFGLLMGLVAITVGCLPRKFEIYRQTPALQRFSSRLDLIDFCRTLALRSRGLRHFDEISHMKWATAYVTYLAYFHVGKFNMSRAIECEANLFSRLLELHRSSAYEGLNCIETQLRKKAFWLMFYAYVQMQYANLRKEKPTFIDCATLHDIDLESLLPVPHDDEYITETSYGSPEAGLPSLAEGFNWRSKVFWCAIRELHTPSSGRRTPQCPCTWHNDVAAFQGYLETRLRDLKYVLDSAPRYLRHWVPTSVSNETHQSGPRGNQIECIRIDIHVTHIWLQSMILDQAELSRTNQSPTSPAVSILSPGSASSSAVEIARAEWAHREDLCRQLLQVLYSASDLSLETLGVILVQKTRDTAMSLLNCPYDDTSESGPAARAKAYLADFARKLQELDHTNGQSSLNIQSWIDTDRNKSGRYANW